MRKLLLKYIFQIEKRMKIEMDRMGDSSDLKKACEYALNSGGKRIRPILVLSVAESIGKGLDVMHSALSVEFFHTASLIADDLPSMDDEMQRRGKPSLHKAFNESTALLASYTLIAAGYEQIYKNSEVLVQILGENVSHKLCAKALSLVSKCAGLNGATHGQFLDLFPPDLSVETLKTVIYQKTVTLFEISFYLGWLFGGGDLTLLDSVKLCAYHLGMAFQIADDLNDLDHSNDQSNFAKALGIDLAIKTFEKHISSYESSLKELNIFTDQMHLFARLLKKSISQAI